MQNLAELLKDQLKDVYNAEKQLTKALPKLVKKAATNRLKEVFSQHLEETEEHVARLEQIGTRLGIRLSGKKCAAMEGLVEEGKEIIDEEDAGPVTDAALIGAAQRVEHYEISAYGTLRTIAERLGYQDVAKLLETTLQEESAADEKLTQISEQDVLPQAEAMGDGEEEEESASGRKRR